ncbi:MAG: sigma-70 family RNA polymerase sigma factor [Oscillospiraceae bacterium]|nr:sigma-70 family RNA polymerase sigma factor [Oscillospiraceae bacterium]
MQSFYDPSLCDATDEQLVAVFPNNAYAFEVLMLRYVRLINHIAEGMTSNPQDAEDYAAEGLLALLNAAYCFCPEKDASFRTYALVCIRNRMRNIHEKTLRESRGGTEASSVSIDGMDDASGELLRDPEGTPETVFLQKERVTALYREMARVLSKREMEIFSLYVDSFSYADIAGRLQISVKSVDNAIQRARRKLRGVRSLLLHGGASPAAEDRLI